MYICTTYQKNTLADLNGYEEHDVSGGSVVEVIVS